MSFSADGGSNDRLLDRPRRSDRNDGCRALRRWPNLAARAGLVVASNLAQRVSGRGRLACWLRLERLDGSAPLVVGR